MPRGGMLSPPPRQRSALRPPRPWPAGLSCSQAAPQSPFRRRHAGLIPAFPDDTTEGPSGRAVERGDAGAGGPAAEGHRPFPAFPSTAGAP